MVALCVWGASTATAIKLQKSYYASSSGAAHRDLQQHTASRTSARKTTAATIDAGWVLLEQSISGSLTSVDLTSSAALIEAGGRVIRMAWSTSSFPGAQLSSYEKIVEFTMPEAVTATENTGAGQTKCWNTDRYTLVDVTCVQGACDLPSQMYTGKGFNRVCYGNGYGLVFNDQCLGDGMWRNGWLEWTIDNQPHKALYLGGDYNGFPCNGVKDNSDTTGLLAGTAMNAISIWYYDPSAAATAPASATGDPHLQNIHGERFDLMKPGRHVLINIPRGERAESALLRVDAKASKLGGLCDEIYFTEVNVTGSWAYEHHVGGYQYDSQGDASDTANWITLGRIEVKVVHAHTATGTKYLNVYVKHLGRAGFAVGGLLGEDDHEAVSTPPVGCEERMSLRHSRAHLLYSSDSLAVSTAEATLA